MLLIGKPSSGKTFMIEEMLINPEMYGSKFDYIFVFSPTPLPTIKCVENENWFRKLSPETLKVIIE